MSAELNQPTSPHHEACTVQERTAIGTAGVVYRAVQTSTKREVTFKVLSRASTHPMEPARVLALRWRLEALQHPVIATLLDAYEDPEGFVIVTSWLAGGVGGNDFPEKLRTLNEQEARLLAMRLCNALLVGEQQHFPHGDIKPSNVILADRGPQGLEVQIQDWGLSACREEQPPETLQFMAPERYHGHPPSVQGDLFSAGATLWFLLTGELPSYGSTRDEVLQSWGLFDAAALAEKRPDLDEHFRQWLAWLLCWQPGDRPASVSQALDVLTGVVSYAAALETQVKSQAVAAVASAPVPEAPGSASLAITPAPSAIVRPAASRPASPSAARPGAPRAATPKLSLPSAPAPLPATVAMVPKKTKDTPPKKAINKGQRAMAFVMALCVIAGIGIAFVAWAEDRYGHDWRQQLTKYWSDRLSSEPAASPAPVPTLPSPKAKPIVAAASSQSSAKPPIPGPGKPAAPPPAGPAKSVSPKPFMVDLLEGIGELHGRTAGPGWKGPWQAQGISLDKTGAVLGKGAPSTASRPLGSLKNLSKDFVALTLMVTHPGKDAPALKLDILSADGATLVAPACVAFEDGKVRVYIEGAAEKIEAPAGKPFRLFVRWDWKVKKSGGKRVVTVATVVDPPLDLPKLLTLPISRRTLPDLALPANFFLVLRSEGALRPVNISDVRVARTLRDALPAAK